MRMTFIVPQSFEVHGVKQTERTPCLVECEVVELVRIRPPKAPWRLRGTFRRNVAATYIAYARLPGWVAAPAKWPRLAGGEVELIVPLHFNKRVPLPDFPPGTDRVRIDAAGATPGEPC